MHIILMIVIIILINLNVNFIIKLIIIFQNLLQILIIFELF